MKNFPSSVADEHDAPAGVLPAPCYLAGALPALLNIICIERFPWAPTLFVFGVVPLLECLVGHRKHYAVSSSNRSRVRKPLVELPQFRAVLIAQSLLCLASLCRTLLFIHANPSALTFTRVLSGAVVGVFSIIAGHEACHKLGPKAMLERTLGSLLIASVLNPAYRGDHPHHHKYVGLPQDAVCAPMNSNPYMYVIRVELNAWKHAMRESLLRARRVRALRLSDPFVFCLAMSVALLCFDALFLGRVVLMTHMAISIGSIVLFDAAAMLQEHAGLARKPGEPMSSSLSWDCSNPVSNAFAFEAGRHSDHHFAGTAAYPELSLLQDAPELPYGLFTIGLIACVWPPLFWRLVRDSIAEFELRTQTQNSDMSHRS